MTYAFHENSASPCALTEDEINAVNGGVWPHILLVAAGVTALTAVFKAGEEIGESLHDLVHGDHA